MLCGVGRLGLYCVVSGVAVVVDDVVVVGIYCVLLVSLIINLKTCKSRKNKSISRAKMSLTYRFIFQKSFISAIVLHIQ